MITKARFQIEMYLSKSYYYGKTQIIPALWLVVACYLLEDRRTIDVIITKFIPCVLKWRKVSRI